MGSSNRRSQREHRGPAPGPVVGDDAAAGDRGDQGRVAGAGRMVDRQVECPALGVPGRGLPVQGLLPAGFTGHELAREEVTEQGMVAVRAPVLVHEEGGLCEPVQELRRVLPICQVVAERPGQLLEDRCARQEGDLVIRAPLEQFGSQVVDDEPIGRGIDPRSLAARPASAEGRERERGWPAAGLAHQLPDLLGGQQQLSAVQPRRLLLVQRELIGTDLQHRPVAAPSREGQVDPVASREHDLRSVGEIHDELGERVEARLRCKAVRIVEDDQDRVARRGLQQSADNGPVRHGAREDGRRRCPDPAACTGRSPSPGRSGRRRGRCRRRRLSARRSTGILGDPLDEEARLAVAGRGDERDERSIRGRAKRAKELRPAHGPCVPARDQEFRLKQAAAKQAARQLGRHQPRTRRRSCRTRK